MEQKLAYSFHLGSDKNKSKLAKKVSKGNVSGTTSLSNNAIQNANALSKVNKHNLRDYDNQRELIRVVYGSNDIVRDVKELYLTEFEEARIEYNNNQTRSDRKIRNYYSKISESQNDLACEIIIELGDMDFWQDKDDEYRFKMIDVYNEQVKDLVKIVPTFKIANATIHFDETSPHMHVVGVPVIENCTRGMKKQVGKTKIFTKESLTKIQDKMRTACIKSFNKFYDMDIKLKEKQLGRNQDINVNDMAEYKKFKNQYEKNKKRLNQVQEKTKSIDNQAEEINSLLTNLKQQPFNKNNKLISNEDANKVIKFTESIKDTNKDIIKVNDLDFIIKEYDKNMGRVNNENSSLKNQIKQKNEEIAILKSTIKEKNETIEDLEYDKEELKGQLSKFKEFWRRLLSHFQEMIGFNKDKQYKYVSDDLYKNGIFDDNDNEIANNLNRKVKTSEEIEQDKKKSKNRKLDR